MECNGIWEVHEQFPRIPLRFIRATVWLFHVKTRPLFASFPRTERGNEYGLSPFSLDKFWSSNKWDIPYVVLS